MVTERTEIGLLRFPEAIGKIPEEDKPLVLAYIRVQDPVQRFYLAQKKRGFYGGLPASAPLPPGGDSPYTIIMKVDDEFRAFHYTEVEPFARFTRQIATRLEDVARIAVETHDPERSLIEDISRSQAQAFRQGDFERATLSILNTRATPRYNFYIGLLDRYLDTDRAIKFAIQSWVQPKNDDQQRYLNDIAQQILRERSTITSLRLRLFVGDMLTAAGMAADRPWGGNTIPSEDHIRGQVGADAYIFTNNLDLRVEEKLKPAMKRYMPQIIQIPNWEEAMTKVTYLGITAHEIGHAQIPFDEQTTSLLGGRYMPIKELMSEVSGLTAAARLPRGILSPSHRQLMIARSLVQWRLFIDEYENEIDHDKKTILLSYALAGEWRLNAQERGGGIRINNNGVIEIVDWDKVVRADEKLYQELEIAIKNEKFQRGFVDIFVRLNSTTPRSYFSHNPYYKSPLSNWADYDTEPFQSIA